RLEIPLKGSYENQLARNGSVETLSLRPGAALFVAPNCWNLPKWHSQVEVMSLLFGQKQLGISIVSAKGAPANQLAANKFSMPTPVSGPIPHILEAMSQLQTAKEPSPALAALASALVHCVRRFVLEFRGSEPTG